MSDADRAYELAQAKIAEAARSGVTELNFSGEAFRALDRLPPEIGKLTGLQSLDLRNTQITDLAPLAGLTGLRRLNLFNTRITDLASLAGLTGLQVLDLRFSFISDVAPLAGLTGLQRLGLDYSQITDLTPLAGLTGLLSLNLGFTRITDLTPLAGLTGLQSLALDKTQITDLAPLAGLTGLQRLFLDGTRITDLAPLASLNGLGDLTVGNTGVADLRPVAELEKLGTIAPPGLSFANTPATKRDKRLAELAQIKDHEERSRETLAYLRSLPPWPEPYTPAATPDGSPPQPIGDMPAAPDPDRVPHLVLGPDNRVDLPPVLPTEAELADPIRERLYQRLPSALDGLLRYSNRYPELDSPARALRGMVNAPFDQADFLLLHLEIDALTDIRASQDSRSETEKLDVDCLTALASVLRIAPPITMGHPDIELLEERGRAYQRSRLPETVAAAESQIARGLEKHELATERTQEFARRTAAAGETGRVAETRRGFTKNVVLIMYFITEQATSAAYGHVFGTPTVAAAQFLLTHKDAILATAPSWGQSGFAWTQYVMIHAQRIIDEARKPD